MKKLISILLVIALALCLAPAALAAEVRVSTQKFELDGKGIELAAYNIDGYNYVQLRGLAAALNGTDKQFSVEYDEESKTIVVVPGEAYTPDEDVYNAPAILTDENGLVTNARESTQKLQIDDMIFTKLSVWNIGGFNYFKLVELQQHLGYGLGYDAARRTVLLTGDGSEPEPAAALSAASDYAEIYKALSAKRSAPVQPRSRKSRRRQRIRPPTPALPPAAAAAMTRAIPEPMSRSRASTRAISSRPTGSISTS